MLSRLRGLHGRWALVVGLLLVVLLGIAVEVSLGHSADDEGAVVVAEPRGRRLYVLIIDSFSVADAAQVPSYQLLVQRGLSAEVEPCLERITYMCIRDALTGRTRFSLFGLFQNWGVAARDPGSNLLRDARSARRSVAMVSAGDLAPFHRDTDKRKVFSDKWTPLELETALGFVDEGADLVVHHTIWHDMAAHHEPVGSPAYQASLKWVDALVANVVKGLPANMDLMVAGDHGHSDDGRHVQGQDIPTVVAVSSPRLAPQKIEARVPISAIRFLSGAVMGLPSASADRAPEWAEWLAPSGTEGSRRLAASSQGAGATVWPVGVALVALAFAGTAAMDVGWVLPLLAVATGTLLGVGFPYLLAVYHFPSGLPRLYEVLWIAPAVVGALVLAARRTVEAATAALAIWGFVALVSLYPVMAHYGLVKNLHNAVVPCLVACAVAAAIDARSLWGRVRAIAVGALLVFGWVTLDDFGIFNVEINDYRFVHWLPRAPWQRGVVFGALAAAFQWAIERPGRPDRRGVLRLGLSVVLGSGFVPLPGAWGLLPLLVFIGALLDGRPASRQWTWLALAASLPVLFNDGRQLGLMGVLCLGALGLSLVAPGRALSPGRTNAAALVLVATAYLGMVWAFGLSITGVDYTFTLKWLPGRWHERLWWLVGLATTVKCVVVPLALGALARVWLGGDLNRVLQRATALVLLRAALVAAFATGWMAWAGAASGGIRLAVVVQDVLYALLVGIGLYVGAGRGTGEPKPAVGFPSPRLSDPVASGVAS